MGRSAPVGRVRRAELCWALVLALLAAIGGIEPTEARSPSDQQDNKTNARNDQRNNPPQSRAAPPARDTRNDNRGVNREQTNRDSTPAVRRAAPADRPSRQETAAPRVPRQDADAGRRPTVSVQQTPSKTSDQRKPPEAAGRQDQKISVRAADRDQKTERPQPKTDATPPRRVVSGDATKPTDRKTGVDSAKTKPPVRDTERATPSDVRRRLGEPDRKKTAPPTVVRDRTTPPVDRRAKDVRWDRFAPNDTAKQLKLAEQYRMSQKGDAARRLELQKHVMPPKNEAARFHHDPRRGYQPHPNFSHHGPVHSGYERNCFQYRYWGPAFFAGLCWYPAWNSWVEWSWRYRCPPPFDPRPVCCRPMVYESCDAWGYWQPPAFVALPAVECGTWVDLPPVVVAPSALDLQLAAVRFVDPGHPEENQGPRYRVWFRNNSNQPISHPFNVLLLAGNGNRLAADLPQAGVRVGSIGPGEIQSVDVRLPVGVYTMGRDASGQPAAFDTLHVLVDANREIRDVDRTNNGVRLSPAQVLPVDPAAFDLEPGTAKPGDDLVLAGEGFGPEPGRLLVSLGGRSMDAELLGWYDLGVRWTVPNLTLTGPTEAEVMVVRGDGAVSNPLKITLHP
ncbi:MAG: hypothetical protein ABFC77_12255 [Thermoguttaceae bacterium]